MTITGTYCHRGSSAQLNCPDGFVGRRARLERIAECEHCAAGYACPAGARTPTACAPSTFATNLSKSCQVCAAGTFQSLSTQSRCEVCSRGHFCPVASAVPSGCPAGTHSNRTRLTGSSQCEASPAGYFSEAASSEATR